MICCYRIRLTVAVILSGILLLSGTTQAESPWDSNASPGFAALASASQKDRYAFVFFWKVNDEQTQRMYEDLQSAVAKMSDAAETVKVRVGDPNERPTVEEFGVARAPLPLVAAVAPNGAVTKAWPLQFREDQLQDGIVSGGTARCMKALQDRKLVVLCVQNAETAHSLVAWQSAQGLKTDERFATASEVVKLDPADSHEASFLQSLQVDPGTRDAVTILLAPPGRPVARFVGAVSTGQIVAKVTSAQSGCCPGGKCGPRGCGPDGNCGPAK
jgi:hypothetical protein